MTGQFKGGFGNVFGNAIHFKHNDTRLHRGHKMIHRALAAAHNTFIAVIGNRFVRKNANPQFTAFLKK